MAKNDVEMYVGLEVQIHPDYVTEYRKVYDLHRETKLKITHCNRPRGDDATVHCSMPRSTTTVVARPQHLTTVDGGHRVVANKAEEKAPA